MAEPYFNEATMRWHDGDTKKMISNPFKNGSKALTVQPQDQQMSLAGGGDAALQPMSPMESLMEVFYEMRDGINTLVQIAQDGLAANRDELRDAELGESDLPPAPPQEGSDPGNEGGGRGGGKPNKFFTKGNLIKGLIIAALAGLFLFSEQIIKALAPILKWVKEKVWPLAVEGLTKAIDGVKLIFDKVKAAFLFLTDPETSLEAKMEGVKTAFKDFGLWLLGLFDNMATKIATAFGMEFEEGETLGSWVGDKLKEGWKSIKEWFEGVAPAWLIDGAKGVGAWVLAKVTGVFQTFIDWFGEAKEAWDEDGAAGVWSWAKAKVIAVFKPFTDWFGEAKDAWDEGGAVGVFSWIVSEIGRAFKGIVAWFGETAVAKWLFDGAAGIWGWITGKIDDAWTTVSDWFSKTGTLLLDGATGIFDWVVDKITAPIDWLIDLFTWPDDPSKSNAEKGITKLLDIVLLPYNLAIAFLRSIFGFSDAEAKEDPDYEEFSLGKFIVGKVKEMFAWVKKQFEFDPSKITEGLMDMGKFMKAISFASMDFIKVLMNPFTKGSNKDAAAEAYTTKFDEIMGGGSPTVEAVEIKGSDTTGQNGTAELLDVTNPHEETASVNVVDASSKSASDSHDNHFYKNMATDHTDRTQEQIENLGRVRPGGFSDVRLKEDIKLVRKSPSDINIYEFKYKGLEGKYEGVMAQEVPWASSVADNGFLWVDYSKLDVEFKRLN